VYPFLASLHVVIGVSGLSGFVPPAKFTVKLDMLLKEVCDDIIGPIDAETMDAQLYADLKQ